MKCLHLSRPLARIANPREQNILNKKIRVNLSNLCHQCAKK